MLANIITIIRLISIIPLSYWIYLEGPSNIWQLVIFVLIIITDFLDGYIARNYNMITKLGKILDPIVDKVLVILVTLVLLLKGVIPAYSLFIYIRDIIVFFGAYTFMFIKKEVVGSDIYGKIKTVLHFFALALILLLGKWQIYSLILLIIAFITIIPESIYCYKKYIKRNL